MPGVLVGPRTVGFTVPETKDRELWHERVARLGEDLVGASMDKDEGIYHLVQDRPVVEGIMSKELPPDEYYVKLGAWLVREFPLADPELIEHAVPLVAAFDTATASAVSFGIAKFQLAQPKVKLVGEIVGRQGRSPDPAIVRAISN